MSISAPSGCSTSPSRSLRFVVSVYRKTINVFGGAFFPLGSRSLNEPGLADFSISPSSHHVRCCSASLIAFSLSMPWAIALYRLTSPNSSTARLTYRSALAMP